MVESIVHRAMLSGLLANGEEVSPQYKIWPKTCMSSEHPRNNNHAMGLGPKLQSLDQTTTYLSMEQNRQKDLHGTHILLESTLSVTLQHVF